MVRAAILIGRIPVARQDNLGFQIGNPAQRCVKFINLEPQQHAVAVRQVRIADATVVMRLFPAVQLQHQAVVVNEPLIVRTAVGTLTPKEVLIPAAAGLDIAGANQRLGAHGNLI